MIVHRTPEEFEALARDPAHGHKITPKSIREPEVGLDFEARGRVPHPIIREPTGAAEFIDAAGQHWDVKGFVSEVPARGGGTRNVFDLDDALAKIEESLAKNEYVMLDVEKLNPQDLHDLLTVVSQRGWREKVIH